jgi:hypothetical protein
MGLESTHPDYDRFRDDWVTMRDLAAGETAVKRKRDVYLPPTPSMILDGFGQGATQVGEQVYRGYLERAVFPDYVSDGVKILVGMLNFKPAEIKLPAKLEPLRDSCTLTGESLDDLLRQIHAEQLITGRLGLLADLPATKNADGTQQPTEEGTTLLPYIAMYIAESITNWDEAGSVDGLSALNLVILDESGKYMDTDFQWKPFKRYRVLQLGAIAANEAEGDAGYLQGEFSDREDASGLTYDVTKMEAPKYMGKTLQEIPFVFVNTKDLVGAPDTAPLLGLGKLVLAIYRGEADYRQGLFLTGQDTLVVIGGVRNPEGVPGEDDALRTGAGSRIDVEREGDAKYIGVNSQGLSEQRASLENDHKRAATRSGQLMPSGKANSQESGEALKTRLAAQTASLTDLAMSSAKALETILKSMATWVSANPDEVEVKPNLEFGEIEFNTEDINGLMDARMKGAPISKRSIHALMKQRRFTSLEFEEEMELVKEEDADMPRVAAGAGTVTADEQLNENQQNRDAAAAAAAAKAQQQGSGSEE